MWKEELVTMPRSLLILILRIPFRHLKQSANAAVFAVLNMPKSAFEKGLLT